MFVSGQSPAASLVFSLARRCWRRATCCRCSTCWSLRRGANAGANPWNATGLEWQTRSPPPTHNFDTPPQPPTDVYGYTPELPATGPGAQRGSA